MARGIYVSATTPGSGKSLVALGLADMLHRHADRIGFFKPVVTGNDAASDPMVALMKARFGLDGDRCRGGLTYAEVRRLLADGKREEIDARAVELFAGIARHCDVAIVEGADLTGQDAAVEFDLNARLANSLAVPIVAVVGVKGRTVTEAADAVEVARKELLAERCELLAVMVNRADPADLEDIAAVDAAIAASKMPGSSVAGQATVFLFPDLNTGNNTYKAVQQSSGTVAVGPVLQGLRKPVNDLSRGCTVEYIVNTVAITAIQAQSTDRAEAAPVNAEA